MNWETYLAFGDSITIGARTYLGYPELVAHQLSKQLNKQWNVINHSVSGFKAIDLARYIDQHFATLQQHKSVITTILIGTNDVKEQTAVEDYEIALHQIILKAKLLTSNKHVVLFSIPELHQGIMYPYSIEMNKNIIIFNGVIDRLAKEHDLRVWALEHTASHFLDGVHLNHLGIAHFAQQVVHNILKDKGINLG